jgi:type I restriction enzyme S subunit
MRGGSVKGSKAAAGWFDEGKTRGMVAELRISAATNQAIAAICLDGSATATKSLVRLALAQNYSQIRSVSMGGVQPNLNLEKVRALAVPLCPMSEAFPLEQIVVEALNRVANVEDSAEEQSTVLAVLNQSLLSKAFRGELVPQDSNELAVRIPLSRAEAKLPLSSPDGA